MQTGVFASPGSRQGQACLTLARSPGDKKDKVLTERQADKGMSEETKMILEKLSETDKNNLFIFLQLT